MDTAQPPHPASPADSGSFFDRLTALATSALGVPVALVSFVEKDRQHFPSACVLEGVLVGVKETPISHSICQHVVRLDEPLIISDTRVHPLTFDNPVVTEVGLQAYAGFPLTDENGLPFGAFCAIDYQPRVWSERDVEVLRTLALQVTSEIQLRAALKQVRDDYTSLTEAEKNRARIHRANRHDLRTPLNAMMLGLQSVEQFGEVNEDQKESLSMAYRNGLQLLSMVDQMLDIGNLESQGQRVLHKESVAARSLLAAALDQTAILAAEKSHHFTHSCEARQEVHADRDKITRVLVNLIGNAIKFTPEGGKISVQVEDVASINPPQVRFSIVDTGIGIPESEQSLIFDEAYRVNPAARTKDSTGLGLAFCKATVEAHGGSIGVTSREGEGSTFFFLLPAVWT